jgi:hypothetical protein
LSADSSGIAITVEFSCEFVPVASVEVVEFVDADSSSLDSVAFTTVVPVELEVSVDVVEDSSLASEDASWLEDSELVVEFVFSFDEVSEDEELELSEGTSELEVSEDDSDSAELLLSDSDDVSAS